MPEDKNGGSDQDSHEVKVTVVDRRHHAREEESLAVGDERSPYPSLIEELKSRAEQAELQAREAIARAEAEIDAVRERLQRDVGRRVDEGRARFLEAVLEVVDNLERAKEVAEPESKSIADGVELIRQQVLGILQAEGVGPIETIGQEFDPNIAEAVGVEQVEPDQHNVVISEVQRGYRLGEKVLRPARVKVGKSHRSVTSD
jgi:molecular chaperone GrpE